MSVTEPSVNEATPSRTEASDIQQNTEELFPQLVLHAQGGSRRDAPSRSQGERDDTPLDNLPITPRSSTPSDGPAQVARALQRPIGVEEKGLLTYEDNEHRTNEHSVGDLIYHLASTETSTQNILLLFMVKCLLDSPNFCRYLIELMIRFRTRNKEENERETIPEADNALIAVDSSSFSRTPVSTNGYPRFSNWGFLGRLTQYSVRRKVKCTPYVRPPVEKDLCHYLILCIYHDHPDVRKNIEREMKTYRELFPPQQMFVERKPGHIEIKLFDGLKGNEKEIGQKRLGVQVLYSLDSINIAFILRPLESGASQKFLKLTLDQTGSFPVPTLLEFTFPYDDIGTEAAATFPSMPAGAQAARVSRHSQIDQVSDRKLETLSKEMPHGSYTTLCIYLDIKYNEANSILATFTNDYRRATRDCLAQWKNRTGGNLAELKAILEDADVGDLVKLI